MLTGPAKTAYQAVYMRERRARERATRHFAEIDREVLLLAGAGYLQEEIAEALNLTNRAVTAALGRVAEYLAPTVPCPRLVLDPGDCLPFTEERYRP